MLEELACFFGEGETLIAVTELRCWSLPVDIDAVFASVVAVDGRLLRSPVGEAVFSLYCEVAIAVMLCLRSVSRFGCVAVNDLVWDMFEQVDLFGSASKA